MKISRINHGSFVISLDFELMWGIIDVANNMKYGITNISNVPYVINQLLTLFQKYDIHATFATVGMIMNKDKTELLKNIPPILPSYKKIVCSPYENNYIENITKNEEHLFFQPKIISALKSAKNIEIGTHTYCHYYCWEKGQTLEEFEFDLKKAIEIAKDNGIEIKSIVFPRNNVSQEHLKICKQQGILCYRGNAVKYYKEPMTQPKQRICRLIDTYFPIAGNTCISYSDAYNKNGLINLRASRLLRPYTPKLHLLDHLKLMRIKKEMLHAAQNNEIYHLWWHPHNFGNYPEQNISFLEKILKFYKELNTKYNFTSYSMGELAKEIKFNER